MMLTTTLAFAQQYTGTNLPAANLQTGQWTFSRTHNILKANLKKKHLEINFKLFWESTPDLNILNWFIYRFMKFELKLIPYPINFH